MMHQEEHQIEQEKRDWKENATSLVHDMHVASVEVERTEFFDFRKQRIKRFLFFFL